MKRKRMRSWSPRCECNHRRDDHHPDATCKRCVCAYFVDVRAREAVVWARVQVRDRGCLLAGVPLAGRCFGPDTPHHLLKDGQGGDYSERNIVVLCAGHNTWCEDQPNRAHALGLVVRRGETHAAAETRRREAGIEPNGGHHAQAVTPVRRLPAPDAVGRDRGDSDQTEPAYADRRERRRDTEGGLVREPRADRRDVR